MKLIDIWNANQAVEKLTKLNKPPKVAYQLMKYVKRFTAEFDVIEAQRNLYIKEASGASSDDSLASVTLKYGTPEYNEFIRKFDEYLQQDADLQTAPITFNALIDTLDAEKVNVISEQDLLALEPLFTQQGENHATDQVKE